MENHDHSLEEATEQLVAIYKDRLANPLVTKDGDSYTFHDRTQKGFPYEFTCKSSLAALSWIAHMAEKNWVTLDHIEIFAGLALEDYRKSGR